ncbi:GNAT family N-acetyltransferase [Streptomyces sp. SID6041]|nr:GNAT family N-acetyltransferase [Streptomyces sp. SID6041]
MHQAKGTVTPRGGPDPVPTANRSRRGRAGRGRGRRYGRQSPESLEARTEGMAHQLRGANIRFTIYDVAGAEPVPVGVATLLPDHQVRSAEYVVMLAPEARGRGLGSAATRLVLDYAFHIVNVRVVWLKVLAPHAGGVRAYENAGFRKAGAVREAGYWLGEVCDELIMDSLARDFVGPSAVRALVDPERE